MATLRKRGKKGIFYALYRDGSGTLIQKKTDTTDRKLAQRIADEFERAARPSDSQRTVENLRRTLAELHKELHGEDVLRMTARDFAKVWLDMKRNEVAPTSMDAYERVTREFVKFLGPRADEDMFLIMREDVLRYRNAQASVVSATTTNHHLRILRMWFKQAREDGWLTENVAQLVKPVKEGQLAKKRKNEKRPFTVPQLRTLLSTIEKLEAEAETDLRRQFYREWKAIVIRGYYTGQRLSDIVSMKAGNEDLLQRQVTMVTHKTGQTIVLEMHEAYISFVLSLPSQDDPDSPLHPIAYRSYIKNKGRVVTLSEQFGKILAKVGFRPERIRKSPVQLNEGKATRPGRRSGKGELKIHYDLSFHSLRHTFVSHLQDAGVPKSVVQDMVGHENAVVNRVYTHLDRSTKRDAISKLPNLAG